jgi:CubicO group peptidase (beta-lactamase class C family)
MEIASSLSAELIIWRRQLLSHSAGFAYPPFNETLNQWSVANGRAMERFYGDFVSEQSPAKFKVPELLIYAKKERDWVRPMVAQPGFEWHYGPGIDWAGRVIERASGQTLEQYMHDHIWSPLGMENITFHPEKRPSLPPMLKMGKQDGPDSPVTPGESVYPIPAHNEAGGAGLFSNAEDYGKLLGALLKDDCPILGEAAVNELLRPQLTKSSRQSLKGHRDSGLILPEIPKDIPVDHSLCGLYAAADVPGRRSEGSVTWDGMSGPNWVSSPGDITSKSFPGFFLLT